jgi:hypothetical protein
LRKKGYSAKDAAQLAAMFHGDYASVPAHIRKKLNRFFFTPTFKIAMAKLWWKMGSNAVRMMVSSSKNMTKTQQQFAAGFAMSVMFNMARDLFMTQILDWEEDEYARRYYKWIEDPKTGKPMEFTMVMSDPPNVLWRYIWKLAKISNPRRGNFLMAVWNQFKSDAHPVWRGTADLVSNYAIGDGEVYNAFDSSGTKIAKMMKFGAKQIGMIALGMEVAGMSAERQKERKRLIKQELGKFGYFLDKFVFYYANDIKSIRLKKEIAEWK